MKCCLLAAGLLLLALPPAVALEDSPTAAPDVVTSSVVSPHIPWAIPLAGGPLRILMVAPRYTLRDAVELGQRVEARLEVVPLWDSSHLGYDPQYPVEGLENSTESAVLDLLNKHLDDSWDVVILGNFDLAVLPESLQQRIIEKVVNGTGLLLSHHRASQGCPLGTFLSSLQPEPDVSFITRGIAETGGRGWLSGKPVLSAAVQDEGRVVQFLYPGDPPQTHALLPQLGDPLHAPPAFMDNAFALVIRAVLWAAKRTPEVYITGLADIAPKGPAEEEIPPDLPDEYVQRMRDSVLNPPSRPFRLELSAEAERDYEVELELRSSDRSHTLRLPAPQLVKGASQFPVEILSLPGSFFVDVWLKNRKGVVDWFSQRMDLKAWPYVQDLKASKTSLLPHDAIELSVEVRAILRPSSYGTIYARATDSLGRVVSESTVGVTSEGGRIVLPMQFADLLAPVVKINVFGFEGPKRDFLDWELMGDLGQTLLLPVRQTLRATRPQLLIAAPLMDEFNARLFLRTLGAHGAGVVYGPGGDTGVAYAAESKLLFLPEIGNYAVASAVDGVIREPCLSNPEYLEGQSLAVREQAEFHFAGSSGLYSLGNGNCLVQSEENVCQCAYCLAGFQAWLEAKYDGLESLNAQWGSAYSAWAEVRPMNRSEARAAGHYAPWVDFRMYMDEIFTEFHRRLRESVRTADSTGQVGARLLGATNPMHGYDWPALLGDLDFVCVDSDPVLLERAKAYRKGDSWSGVMLPRDANDRTRRYWLWNALLHQLPLAWWPDAFGTANAGGNAEGVLPDGRVAGAITGLEETLRAVHTGAGELLLRATPQAPGVAILESTASRHLNEVEGEDRPGSIAAEGRFLAALDALGYATRFVPEQMLIDGVPGEIRVLLLPEASALSDATVAALRRFAEAGGTLVADRAPGSFDQHGVPRSATPLADLFDGQAEEAGTSGPRALLLEGLEGAEFHERLQAMLASAGCAPAIAMPGKHGRFQGKRFQFQYGKATLYALLADARMKDDQRVRIPLARGMHAFDLRTQLPAVGVKRVSATIAPGDAGIFSVLPYEVEELLLLAPETVFAGRRLELRIGVTAHKDTPGDHLVRIEFGPEFGEPLPCYQQMVRCPSGVGSTYLPLAFNEKLGRYVVSATDILSGVSAQAYVQVGFIAANPGAG